MSLEVVDLHTYYGLSHVLQGVGLSVEQGEVVALLGRNGAGKTTTLRSIMGLTPPREGHVRVEGRELAGRPPHVIARSGLGFVPSGRRIFGTLTVAENLAIASKPGPDGRSNWTSANVYELFPALARMQDRKALYMSGGEQQMLKIGRALMGNPSVLLLDEPTEGLAPAVVHDVGRQIARLSEAGLGILLCEQNATFALELASRGYILEKGMIRFSGDSTTLRDSPAVRTYLGV
jgi:branched-chain amino acid transport system ATP-binding protein